MLSCHLLVLVSHVFLGFSEVTEADRFLGRYSSRVTHIMTLLVSVYERFFCVYLSVVVFLIMIII